MRDDLSDLDSEDLGGVESLDKRSADFISQVGHFTSNAHKKNVRSPFLAVNGSYGAAKQKLENAQYSRAFQTNPGYLVEMD